MPEKLFEYITDEQQFLNSVKNGSRLAFGQLYDRYAPSLFGIIDVLTNHDTQLSEKILHDSFYAIWQNIGKYEASGQRLFTWMIGLTRHMALETLHNKEIGIQKPTNSVNNPIEGIGSANKISKSALELICFNGYSMQEAAKKLDICIDDLKIKLRQELNTHRQTSI